MAFTSIVTSARRVGGFGIPAVYGRSEFLWMGFVVASSQTSHLHSCGVVLHVGLPQSSEASLGDGRLPKAWGENGELADVFPFDSATEMGSMIPHPEFRDNLAD